ncbi:MAG: hypothetical protein MI674_01675 [Cytophagales bacterium]|nr:hypothetical protein [Cytophagales bacterium]
MRAIRENPSESCKDWMLAIFNKLGASQQEQAVAILASGQPAKRAIHAGVYPTKDSWK